MGFNPAVLGLIVPFMLLVLLYFQRKRRHEQNRANDDAAERLSAADPAQQLQELLQIEIDHEEGETEASFQAFLGGRPTRRLSAEWFYSLYHGALALVMLAVVAVVVISSAIANAIVAYILIATVLIVLLAVWLSRFRTVQQSNRVRTALTHVLNAHNLSFGAVIDQTCRVIGTAGELDQLQDAWLAPQLLGRRGEAARTYGALGWMPRPQVVATEQTVAIADKPSPTLVVVVFGHRSRFGDDDDGRRADSISDTIRTEFATWS